MRGGMEKEMEEEYSGFERLCRFNTALHILRGRPLEPPLSKSNTSLHTLTHQFPRRAPFKALSLLLQEGPGHCSPAFSPFQQPEECLKVRSRGWGMVQSCQVVLPGLGQALVSNFICLRGFLSDKLDWLCHHMRDVVRESHALCSLCVQFMPNCFRHRVYHSERSSFWRIGTGLEGWQSQENSRMYFEQHMTTAKLCPPDCLHVLPTPA